MIIELLSKLTGSNPSYVIKIVNSASYRYKSYPVKKRNGQYRIVEQPSKEVKALQRIIVNHIISKLPVHDAAKAYKSGISIKDNAEAHLKNPYLLKMDFENFFPSISMISLIKFLSKSNYLKLNNTDNLNLCKLVCRNGHLVIGAPSSPSISNAYMFEFDMKITEAMKPLGITYTRYADDLAFSSPKKGQLEKVEPIVRAMLQMLNYPLKINNTKTVFTSKKRLRRVTGLVLTSQNKISIGRTKKRALKAQFYKLLNNELDETATKSLQGNFAYVLSVEPSFISCLRKKHGPEFDRGLLLLINSNSF